MQRAVAVARDLQVRLNRVDSPADSRGRRTRSVRKAGIIPSYREAYERSRSSSRDTSASKGDQAAALLSGHDSGSGRSGVVDLTELTKLTRTIDSALRNGVPLPDSSRKQDPRRALLQPQLREALEEAIPGIQEQQGCGRPATTGGYYALQATWAKEAAERGIPSVSGKFSTPPPSQSRDPPGHIGTSLTE